MRNVLRLASTDATPALCHAAVAIQENDSQLCHRGTTRHVKDITVSLPGCTGSERHPVHTRLGTLPLTTEPPTTDARAEPLPVYARLGPLPLTTEPPTSDTRVERLSVHARLGPLLVPTKPIKADTRAERRLAHSRLGPLPLAAEPAPAQVSSLPASEFIF